MLSRKTANGLAVCVAEVSGAKARRYGFLVTRLEALQNRLFSLVGTIERELQQCSSQGNV